GYYREASIIDRLHDDVIAPARARGVETIWLAGISLGGLGASLYARDRPGEIDGLALIAPYLGEDEILEEIEKAGGPRAWHPEAALAGEDVHRLWIWFQGYAGSAGPTAAHPTLLLAFGEGDRLRRGQRLLARLLPPERVVTARGGHFWATWRRLWDLLLAKGEIGRSSALR
ncbi:MAG TPA: alpha/beta hydrolase, partial [Thermoanaerobaculia bacterium]|nr:alpha/beta hydrolase [Thermoanaerobaculia bacterium]